MEGGPDDSRLVLASDAQKRARDVLTAAAWGTGLSLDAYLRREDRLRAVAVPRLGMRTWFLVGAEDVVFSSCETFTFPSVLREGLRELWGQGYGVASVFTEPALRGQGHATRLLDRVCQVLSAEPGAQAVMLYSDVGASQYARSGFVARPAFDWSWPAAPASASTEAAFFGEEALGWRWAAHPPPAGRFLVHPSVDTLDWCLERERIYCAELGRPRPRSCGAALGHSLALWYAQPRDGRLWIHWLDAEGAASARALVTAARMAARDAGLTEVRLWEDGDGFVAEGMEGGLRQARAGSLPMIRPLDPRVRPEDWRRIPRALWV